MNTKQQYYNSIKDRPGLATEIEFRKWLDECEGENNKPHLHGIYNSFWYSAENNLATIDFMVPTINHLNTTFFIDVVGYKIRNGEFELNTSHKNWDMICNYIEEQQNNEYELYIGEPKLTLKGYLAFKVNSDWFFYPIKRDNPNNNIYLSEERKKHIRTAKQVFGGTVTDDKVWKTLNALPCNDEALWMSLYIKKHGHKHPSDLYTEDDYKPHVPGCKVCDEEKRLRKLYKYD